jgi:hypothetical protein
VRLDTNNGTMGTYAGHERRKPTQSEDVVPVRLTHKYADLIDGVNLSGCHVGERLCLSPAEARLLIAEGWAEPVDRDERRSRDVRGQRGRPDRDHQRCA